MNIQKLRETPAGRVITQLGFQHRIILLCIISGVVPVLILCLFSYNQLKTILLRRETEALRETAKQAATTLDYRIGSYYDVIDYIIWNGGISNAFSRKYNNNYEMYLAYKQVIDPVIGMVPVLNTDIKAIRFYTDSNINPRYQYLMPLDTITDKEWLNSVLTSARPLVNMSPRLTARPEEGLLEAYCQIPSRRSVYTSVIVMTLEYDAAFGFLASLYADAYTAVVMDEAGRVLYTWDTAGCAPLQTGEGLPRGYAYEKAYLKKTGLSLYLLRPLKTITAAANSAGNLVLALASFCVCFLVVSVSWLSGVLVRPLKNLTENMRRVEDDGDFSITITSDAGDEIGVLIRRFQSMMKKLQYMVEEVYQSKIRRQEYEMKALQAQINPHFFYNSLSLINSKAIMAKQPEISSMARYLSIYYRTALNKGRSTIRVREEWDNMHSYIQIQKLMHRNSFDAVCVLEEDTNIKEQLIPNLIIQPLVENAIEHGLDHKETPGRGELRVTGRAAGKDIVFTVRDNGPGISEEKLRGILSSQTEGYGLYNVHQRLQLMYGEQYGISIDSRGGGVESLFLSLFRVSTCDVGYFFRYILSAKGVKILYKRIKIVQGFAACYDFYKSLLLYVFQVCALRLHGLSRAVIHGLNIGQLASA
ncbi:MAG: histidine kinase [Clostridiales bacterium]|nr:histidine kinase [Clostridiales bacterium]